MMKYALTLLGMVFSFAGVHAQDDIDSLMNGSIDSFRKAEKARYDAFRRKAHQDYEDFRRQCMEEYVAFVRNPWKAFEETKPVPMPKEEPVPPVVMPKEEKEKPIEDKPIVIKEIVKPIPTEPQPTPVAPIKEVPVVQEKTVSFTFFGTPGKVRFDTANRIKLEGTSENDIANALSNVKSKEYDNILLDCLSLRKNLQLSDWGYLQMLKTLADKVCGTGTNESTLMLAYLYMQSGYKMRLATNDNKLYMLYASKHQIFNQVSYNVDGDMFYGVDKLPNRLHICQAAFPKEKGMSLQITNHQLFAQENSSPRTVVSEQFKDMKITFSVNKNQIDFFNTYPASIINDNVMTKWGIYANTPLDPKIKEQVYPTLKARLEGLTDLEAANKLLNMIQTGLEYEYDNKVWGYDRAFFAEESLYYPFCDCEDRSILYTRLVRDLLGLECILIYYPGHLASAVAFKEEVKGDYILLDGRKFIVSDPTYIGAPVGRTMSGMDNKTAKVILLDKQF